MFRGIPIYPLTSKENSPRIRIEIRRVLMTLWDPIGVKDSPCAQDEYDGYIDRMFELLILGGSDEHIKEHLDWAVSRMGMNSSRHSGTEVIRALRSIPLDKELPS